MDRYQRKFLEEFLKIASPSGFEDQAKEFWKKRAKLFADQIYENVHGNVVAQLNGKSDKKIMLAGHIDEIGLMVSYISPSGLLYFRPVGGWDPQILPGQRVKVYTRKNKVIKGVIGRPPIHSLSSSARAKAVRISDLWIDTGRSKKYVNQNISVGDYAVIDYNPEFLNKAIASRGLDDKIGAFVVLEALARIKTIHRRSKATVCATATVQEEIGLRGATTITHQLNPVVGIAVDVIFATDYPYTSKSDDGDIKLGKGPVISIGPNINKYVYELLVSTAEAMKIPYQVRAEARATGTDANAIQLSRNSVATGLISIPNRYMHSPNELVNKNDVENAIKLLNTFCLNKKMYKRFGI